MADTVTTQTIADTSGVKFVAKLTNFSDGTGETLVKKVDASELTFMSEDGNRTIARVYYSMDFRTDGNSIPNNATTPTGDVLLSTKNFASGDNYTIIVEFR